MAVKSNFIGRNVPSLTAKKSQPMTTNFARGIYTYKPNDTMDSSEVRLAQDARYDRVGEYGTRLGYKRLWGPIGKSTVASNYGSYSSGSADAADSYTYTAASDGRLYSVNVSLAKKVANKDDYIVPKVTVSLNGNYLTSACIDPNSLTTGLVDFEVAFNDAPDFSESDVLTVSISTQSGSLSGLATAIVTGGIIRCKINTATAGSVTSIFEANIDGDKSIFFVFNGKLYWRTSRGITVSIRTLPAGTTKVRFCQNLNTIRYTDGMEAPHLLTPTVADGEVTSWSDSVIPTIDLETETDLGIKVSNIMNAPADDLMYFDAETDTQVVWTYAYGYSYAKSPAFSTTATIQGNPGDTLTINSSTISPSGIAVGDWI